jgi:ketosteroid isomerase-like protein
MTNANKPQAQSATALIDALVKGDVDGVRKLFAGPAEIDDPFAGRHVDGGFERMVREWAPAHLATVKSIELTSCTVQGDRSGSEITLHLVRNGEPVDVFAVIVCDHAPDGRIERSRIYYRRAWIDGKQHHRRPILDHRPVSFNPVMARYQKGLHTGDPEMMISTFRKDLVFDGHGQSKDMSLGIGMGRYSYDEMAASLRQMFDLNTNEGGPSLEYLNAIDDGKTTVLEFNLHQGVHEDPEPRGHAGVACYEYGDDGLIKEARIYDEAW